MGAWPDILARQNHLLCTRMFSLLGLHLPPMNEFRQKALFHFTIIYSIQFAVTLSII